MEAIVESINSSNSSAATPPTKSARQRGQDARDDHQHPELMAQWRSAARKKLRAAGQSGIEEAHLECRGRGGKTGVRWLHL